MPEVRKGVTQVRLGLKLKFNQRLKLTGAEPAPGRRGGTRRSKERQSTCRGTQPRTKQAVANASGLRGFYL
jgi:hypothetical protein